MDKYNIKYKVCSTCKVTHPKTEEFFYVRGNSKLTTDCKECVKEKARIYRKIKKKQREKEKKQRVEGFLEKGNWKKIEGFEEYFISDCGKVFSTYTEKLISLGEKENGYLVANLWKGNKGNMRYVHRLVKKHFGNTEEDETVNHKDGDKSNNHISNLEWMSYKENNRHAIDTGLITTEHRRNNKNSIPVKQLTLDGQLVKVHPSMRQAERDTGITVAEISLGIQKGWKYGGYQWELANE